MSVSWMQGFGWLVAAAIGVTSVSDSRETSGPAPPAAQAPAEGGARRVVIVRGTNAPRRPARPLRSSQERLAQVVALREAYRLPPANWPRPTVDEGVEWQELGLLPEVVHPPENPGTPEKIELGKMLFFDPRLSGTGQMACASCHDPELAWSDRRSTSFGVDRKVLARNAPSVMNAGYKTSHFWDGRAESLEDQAKQVLVNPDEMRSKPKELIAKLNAIPGYRERFKQVFGNYEVTFDEVARALACFERTVVGGYSRFDAYLRGNDAAMSDAALVGLDLFRREAGCMNCHHGPLMTDGQFHNVGLSYYGRKFEDLGRYELTGAAADVGKFRTPSLRNFGATGPYMHNGLFPTARGILNMYNVGMPTLRRKAHQQDDPLFPTKSPHLKPLGLNRQDLSDLEEFLNSLTEPYRRVRQPELPVAEVAKIEE